jgi:hypothetical protein
LPVSPPRKWTKTSSSTPNLKSPSIRTPSLLKKSLSISKYLYPVVTRCKALYRFQGYVHSLIDILCLIYSWLLALSECLFTLDLCMCWNRVIL